MRSFYSVSGGVHQMFSETDAAHECHIGLPGFARRFVATANARRGVLSMITHEEPTRISQMCSFSGITQSAPMSAANWMNWAVASGFWLLDVVKLFVDGGLLILVCFSEIQHRHRLMKCFRSISGATIPSRTIVGRFNSFKVAITRVITADPFLIHLVQPLNFYLVRRSSQIVSGETTHRRFVCSDVFQPIEEYGQTFFLLFIFCANS